jgi:hypothetical protein
MKDLLCLKCGRHLARVVEHKGHTALLLYEADSITAFLTRGEIVCPAPKCGGLREFYSVPMSAIRLGIAEVA